MPAENTTEPKASLIEIVRDAMELIEPLQPDDRRKAIAMIAANYELEIKKPYVPQGRGYAHRPTKKRSW